MAEEAKRWPSADETGRIAGKGMGGRGNHQLSALAEASIRQAVEEALGQAGLQRENIACASFGLAGADREADFRILRPMIGAMGFKKHHIACDTVIAMRAGTRQRDGVVLICGAERTVTASTRQARRFRLEDSVMRSAISVEALTLPSRCFGRSFVPGKAARSRLL